MCILGNHESATMNQMYGFEGEVKEKYVLNIIIKDYILKIMSLYIKTVLENSIFQKIRLEMGLEPYFTSSGSVQFGDLHSLGYVLFNGCYSSSLVWWLIQ